MAGNRLYSEFQNDNGDVYRVSIYDTNATWNPASASTFKLGSDGFCAVVQRQQRAAAPAHHTQYGRVHVVRGNVSTYADA